MTFANPWAFPCQLPGPADIDLIKPAGIDQTCSEWITLVVPEPLARELANRWYGGVGSMEVSKDRAVELLRGNECWRLLNPEAVRRWAPDLVPTVERDVAVLIVDDTDKTNVLRAHDVECRKKRQRIEAALKSDAARTDDMIAAETGTSRSLVRKIREGLEGSGEIRHVPQRSRAQRPRPKKYQRRVAMAPRRSGRR
jgi:hypothetical protein